MDRWSSAIHFAQEVDNKALRFQASNSRKNMVRRLSLKIQQVNLIEQHGDVDQLIEQEEFCNHQTVRFQWKWLVAKFRQTIIMGCQGLFKTTASKWKEVPYHHWSKQNEVPDYGKSIAEHLG